MERARITAEQAKLRYDELVRADPLALDDWVLLRRQNRFKFQSRWLGLYDWDQLEHMDCRCQTGKYELEKTHKQLRVIFRQKIRIAKKASWTQALDTVSD
jgi:hypothetical protein